MPKSTGKMAIVTGAGSRGALLMYPGCKDCLDQVHLNRYAYMR